MKDNIIMRHGENASKKPRINDVASNPITEILKESPGEEETFLASILTSRLRSLSYILTSSRTGPARTFKMYFPGAMLEKFNVRLTPIVLFGSRVKLLLFVNEDSLMNILTEKDSVSVPMFLIFTIKLSFSPEFMRFFGKLTY